MSSTGEGDGGNTEAAENARNRKPVEDKQLWNWIAQYTGVEIATQSVCPGHNTPWDIFLSIQKRPPLALVLGPRGGGKSFLSALDTHLNSRWDPGHETCILGGSRSQSEQVYRGLRELVRGGGDLGSDADSISKLLKGEAAYKNGSRVSILAASSTSVRGPHVPSLKLDEVDEIDSDCREAAMGMCMGRLEKRGRPATGASVIMTSTWHKPNGPMAELMGRALAGNFPLLQFCIFEVLERCPDERSGRSLEKCPECPLMSYCHEGMGGLQQPKAKRSNGHYPIDSLIQKFRATGKRTFESDYLCKGPKTDALWFKGFDPEANSSLHAEYDPALPVQLAIDTGVFTGAVFFQIAPMVTPAGCIEEVRIFADYLTEGLTAERNARQILEMARTLCHGRINKISTDPSGGARNAIGPTVIGEYERVGLRPLNPWPMGSVVDGLALIESFTEPASGTPQLVIHPRCRAMIQSFQNYRRRKRSGQMIDLPEDPQHPHEDLMDALRGGLRSHYPNGRRPDPIYHRVSARQVF